MIGVCTANRIQFDVLNQSGIVELQSKFCLFEHDSEKISLCELFPKPKIFLDEKNLRVRQVEKKRFLLSAFFGARESLRAFLRHERSCEALYDVVLR